MKKFMVIARVNNKDYMVKIEAASESAAEHSILDRTVCGRHEYGVDACVAYGRDMMKTDSFIAESMNAETVSENELNEIIAKRNERIMAKDAAEDKIRKIKKHMKQLETELEEAKKILAD